MFRLLLLLLPLAMVLAENASADHHQGEFISIFDGKSLQGWDGNPKFWTVADGAITGQTTQENPTDGNTFLIWQGGDVENFELKLEYKIVSGNSGIQYRSFALENAADRWRVGGYQADLEAGDRYSGIFYGEAFRGIMADRGEKTVLTTQGGKFHKEVTGSVGDSDVIGKQIKKGDWNSYHVTARNYRMVHQINGTTTSEVVDRDMDSRRAQGLLGLQLHAGPPMKVQFRNIRLKKTSRRSGREQRWREEKSGFYCRTCEPASRA